MPLTLKPISARNYEMRSLASAESTEVLLFLMRQPKPTPEVEGCGRCRRCLAQGARHPRQGVHQGQRRGRPQAGRPAGRRPDLVAQLRHPDRQADLRRLGQVDPGRRQQYLQGAPQWILLVFGWSAKGFGRVCALVDFEPLRSHKVEWPGE
jgi:hypothetical protein